MEYTSVNNIADATHWISLPDADSPVRDSIIPHKTYKLHKIKDDIDFEEYYIIDENNNYAMTYICHKGMFVKERMINENS